MITSSNRGLWLTCCLLLGCLVGVIGGTLDYTGGHHVAEAITTGATAFAATITLTVLMLTFFQQAARQNEPDDASAGPPVRKPLRAAVFGQLITLTIRTFRGGTGGNRVLMSPPAWRAAMGKAVRAVASPGISHAWNTCAPPALEGLLGRALATAGLSRRDVAAATSIRTASTAALDIPALYGTLTRTHPADDDGTNAMSWATDGDQIHVGIYRALATTIDGVQLQRLREPAGWLVPTGWATLRPDHGIDADHPAAVLLASWLLIAHRLSETVVTDVEPGIRKAYTRTGRPAPEVRVIRLRPSHRPPGRTTNVDPSTQPEPGHRDASDADGTGRRTSDH